MSVDVYQAVASRRAVRRFTGEQVPRAALERVLKGAARSPSGANLQPWHVYVLSGAPLAELKRRTAARVAAGDAGDEREFAMYPSELGSPYRERRSAAAAQRYRAFGIARDDEEGRRRAVAENWECFGAPTLLLCYIDGRMGPAQWADVGMYLQTVMLLLRGEGLHSCPQMAWSVYHETVAQLISCPRELVLFAGLSIGYEDTAFCDARTERAPLAETVVFVGG